MILEGPADTVHTEVSNGVGRLVLDRPKALNALDLTMIRALRDALESWRDDDAVTVVVVESTSEKAFCAGGDIRGVRAAVLAGEGEGADTFFAQEYALNRCVAEYPKPYVALIDGICFGGGLGISAHGSHRVVTDRARLAMPETAIGFVPDIGSSYFLSRLPGRLGRATGLTGLAIGGADAVRAGLGTHFVPAAQLADVRSALLAGGDPTTVLAQFADATPAGPLADQFDAIAACFEPDDLAEVAKRLDETDAGWAEAARAGFATASPMSLRVTDELIRAGAQTSLGNCLRNELAVVEYLIRTSDFDEGVRARLVDKDNRPTWAAGTALTTEVDGALAALRRVATEPEHR